MKIILNKDVRLEVFKNLSNHAENLLIGNLGVWTNSYFDKDKENIAEVKEEKRRKYGFFAKCAS